ncbi:M23 family peptidase [Paroceanicella profunda]|uniref:M23 family peptidase n=1 Tax=Paroceanicella profunda TaxID=2579971 RepID=A0A5B8G195_9RHOB|nr:DUF5930 domain-containing protein [Paroceanicella profunda]QDL92959.1 M23 family peptidase [Paroceanicella profunda]
MAAKLRRVHGALGRVCPEQKVFIRSESATRCLRLSPVSQIALCAALAIGLSCTAVATARFTLGLMDGTSSEEQLSLLRQSYEQRIATLSHERDLARETARSAQERFQAAMVQVAASQADLVRAGEETRARELTLEAVREKLAQVVRVRDHALRENGTLTSQLAGAEGALDRRAGSETDLSSTLQTISYALSDSVRKGEQAEADAQALNDQLASMRDQAALERQRQQHMLEKLEEAVSVSLDGLDSLLASTGMNPDDLVAEIRKSYSGEGGPLIPASAVVSAYDDDPENVRVTALMQDMERIQLMRIAAAKLPLAKPVHVAYRLTSPFGVRRDPFTHRSHRHDGVDLAGPRGTPITSTAEGEVVFAGRQRGYGNVIKIRHAFGVETVYGHLSKIRVKRGEHVAVGDRIGDMGSTGRSTGSHLHYEIRIDGTAVNPLTYLKAAKNVL